MGGRTNPSILREDARFIEKVKSRNIILIVGGNDVQRATTLKEFCSKSLISCIGTTL